MVPSHPYCPLLQRASAIGPFLKWGNDHNIQGGNSSAGTSGINNLASQPALSMV